MPFSEAEQFRWFIDLQYRTLIHLTHLEEKMGQALDNLNAKADQTAANIALLSADVDALLSQPIGDSEADVQLAADKVGALADSVGALDAKVKAAITPQGGVPQPGGQPQP